MRKLAVLLAAASLAFAQNNGATLGWYGATDPTGATDNSTTFATAVAACNGELDIPAGSYLVNTQLSAWPATPCRVIMKNGAVMTTGFPPNDGLHSVMYQSAMPIYPPSGAPSVVFSTVNIGVPLGVGSGGTGGSNQRGLLTDIVTSSGNITNTETSVVAYTVPANSITTGTIFRMTLYGFATSTTGAANSFNVRFGGAGTAGDTALVTFSPTSAATGTTIPFYMTCTVTFQSTTAAVAGCVLNNNTNTGIYTALVAITSPSAPVTGLTTTTAQILHFGYASGNAGNSANFVMATIEKP